MFTQQYPADLNGVIFSRQRLRRVEGRLSLPAAASSSWSTVAQLTLPSTDHGYITAYSNEVIDPSWDYNGAILFRVLVNESAIDDCDSFQEQRGTIPQPAEALFYVPPGQIIVLQARRAVLGVGTRDVVMGALVATWPQQLASPFPRPPGDPGRGMRRITP